MNAAAAAPVLTTATTIPAPPDSGIVAPDARTAAAKARECAMEAGDIDKANALSVLADVLDELAAVRAERDAAVAELGQERLERQRFARQLNTRTLMRDEQRATALKVIADIGDACLKAHPLDDLRIEVEQLIGEWKREVGL